MILTIIIFILILGLLVFVHELGHFVVAKKSGMKVLEFGFGFPPRLFGWYKTVKGWKVIFGHAKLSADELAEQAGQAPANATIYSINVIPLGGFVKIWGENNEHEKDPQSFINRPFWARLLTLLAGVLMNWVLAAVLFSLIFMIGRTVELVPELQNAPNVKISERQVGISGVLSGSPAEKAGLLREDIVLSVDGRQFESSDELQKYIRERKGQVFSFVIQRISEVKTLEVKSLENPGPNQGPTGIGITDIAKVRLPFWLSVKAGFQQTVFITQGLFKFLAEIFRSSDVLENVGGPVKIAQIVGQVRQLGIVPLIQLTGFLSVNLAILNLLPFPALDGGRILFLIVEKLRGKRNNPRVEQAINAAGFAFLILLMVLVTIKDVRGFGS